MYPLLSRLSSFSIFRCVYRDKVTSKIKESGIEDVSSPRYLK